MIKFKEIKVVIIVALIAASSIFWYACTEERLPCLTPTIASLNIVCVHFPSDTSTVFTDTSLPAAIFGAVTTKGIREQIFPQQATFTISLSSDTEYCRWLFSPDTANSGLDTISFYYQRSLQFLSNACGFAYFYNLDSVHLNVTHRFIDSVLILNGSVTNNANVTQLEIFIHPPF